MTGRGLGVDVEVTGVQETISGLGKTQAALDPLSANMRAAVRESGDGLARALVSAAMRSPTPQARLVAQTIAVRQTTTADVQLGGGAAVGSRGTPARELVEGSEHGGHNFVAPRNAAGYWIKPTIERYQQSGEAAKPVQAGADRAVQAGGF
jgi:hypothetical protein